MQKYTEFLIKIVKSSILQKKKYKHQMNSVINPVGLEKSWVQKQTRDKAYIPNLIYIALHALFCEIMLNKNGALILRCIYLVIRIQAKRAAYSKIKIF